MNQKHHTPDLKAYDDWFLGCFGEFGKTGMSIYSKELTTPH